MRRSCVVPLVDPNHLIWCWSVCQVKFSMGITCTNGNSTCLCCGRIPWGRALRNFDQFGMLAAAPLDVAYMALPSGLWRRDRNIKHSRLHGTWYGRAFQSIGILAYKHVQCQEYNRHCNNANFSYVSDHIVSDFWISKTSRWEILPPMSEPRGGDANGDPNIVACVLGNYLYVTRIFGRLTLCKLCVLYVVFLQSAWFFVMYFTPRMLTFPTRSEVDMRWTAWNAAWILNKPSFSLLSVFFKVWRLQSFDQWMGKPSTYENTSLLCPDLDFQSKSLRPKKCLSQTQGCDGGIEQSNLCASVSPWQLFGGSMPDPYALSIKVCGGKDDNDAEEPEFCTAWWILVFFENYQTTFTSVFVAQPFWKKYAAVAPGTKLSGRIWSCHRLLGSPSIHEHSTSQCWCGGFWRYLRCTKNVTRRCPSCPTSNDGTEVISIFVEVGFWKQFQLLSSSNLMFWTILCGWYVVAWTEFARWYPIDDLSNWSKDFLWIFLNMASLQNMSDPCLLQVRFILTVAHRPLCAQSSAIA